MGEGRQAERSYLSARRPRSGGPPPADSIVGRAGEGESRERGVTDVLERIVSGRTKRNELHTLLPWNWAASVSAAIINQAA
jgi:hypothetical protein